MWQSAGHLSNNRDTMFTPVIESARRRQPDHGDEASGDFGKEQLESDDYGQYCERYEETRKMCLSEVLEGKKELPQEAVPALFDAEHIVQLSAGYLYTDSRQEPNENCAREKIREEA